MRLFIKLVRRQIYVEYADWASPQRCYDAVRDNRELLIWIGRFHIIYTPPHWSPKRRAFDVQAWFSG